jgi:hypothetical protein
MTLIFGLFLMFVGGSALLLNTGFQFFGAELYAWHLWPLFVMGLGLVFCIAPFLVHNKPGLGGLFIPGLPIMATGTLLALGSIFHLWNVWSFLWPVELISLALGFLCHLCPQYLAFNPGAFCWG